MKKLSIIVATCAFLFPLSAEDKNITIMSASGTIDGKVTIHTEQLEECIVSMPSISSLAPVVKAESKYMKEINGEADKNDYVKCYSAELEISYMTRQKSMIVVSSNTVQGGAPQKEIVSKKIPITKKFVSNAANGDAFANRSQNEYYFTSAQKAIDDVTAQASAWIKAQSAIICDK